MGVRLASPAGAAPGHAAVLQSDRSLEQALESTISDGNVLRPDTDRVPVAALQLEPMNTVCVLQLAGVRLSAAALVPFGLLQVCAPRPGLNWRGGVRCSGRPWHSTTCSVAHSSWRNSTAGPCRRGCCGCRSRLPGQPRRLVLSLEDRDRVHVLHTRTPVRNQAISRALPAPSGRGRGGDEQGSRPGSCKAGTFPGVRW